MLRHDAEQYPRVFSISLLQQSCIGVPCQRQTEAAVLGLLFETKGTLRMRELSPPHV